MKNNEQLDRTIERLRAHANRANDLVLVSVPATVVNLIMGAQDIFDTADETSSVDNFAFAGLFGVTALVGFGISRISRDCAEGFSAIRAEQR